MATLAAGHTNPYLFEPPLSGLVRKFRVANKGPAHPNQIGVTFRQNLLRLDRVVNPIGTNDRKIDHRLDP